jgi:hypothetical protein
MDEELFLIDRIDGTTSLCVSPVSSKTFALSELDNLGGDRGYFLYEVDERPIVGGMQILAKIASLDAAFRLSEIWKMATSKDGRAPLLYLKRRRKR